MGEAGHKIILVNKGFDAMTVMTGISRYVDKFYLISFKEVYDSKLKEIWHKERVDWFLPMNLSIDDIRFKIFMDFEAMQQRLNFSTIAINNIFMVKMLQDRQEFFKKCHALGTIHILRKHLYSTKLNVITQFFIKTGFLSKQNSLFFNITF